MERRNVKAEYRGVAKRMGIASVLVPIVGVLLYILFNKP